MEEFRGTAGPWVAEKTSRAVGPVSKDDDQSYGMCLPVAWVEFDQEVEIQAANQNLIAAAPEMFEALRSLYHAVLTQPSGGTQMSIALERTRDTLHKALGK